MNYVKVFSDWAEQTSELTDEEFGSLMRALMIYASGRGEPALAGAAKYVFPVFRMYVDREAEAYEKKVKQSVEAGKKSAIARKKKKSERELTELNENERALTKMNQEQEQEQAKEKEDEKENELIYQEQEHKGTGDDPDMNDDLEKINNFIREKGLKCDGREFYDYYSERNWEIGGKKIDNWKGLLVSWDKSNKTEPLRAVKNPPRKKSENNSSFDTDDFFEAAVRASMNRW